VPVNVATSVEILGGSVSGFPRLVRDRRFVDWIVETPAIVGVLRLRMRIFGAFASIATRKPDLLNCDSVTTVNGSSLMTARFFLRLSTAIANPDVRKRRKAGQRRSIQQEIGPR
jgi:hypothetical protein